MCLQSIRMENKHGCLGQLNGDRDRRYHRQQFIIHFGASEEAMTYVSDGRLVSMALDALEQVAARASIGIVRRDWSIAVCLAYLATRKRSDRWPFDKFWQALECPDQKLRSANTNRYLNGIYVQLGLDRTNSSMFKYAYQDGGQDKDQLMIIRR